MRYHLFIFFGRLLSVQSFMEKKNKKKFDECHQKILYLEAYSRRENIKLEGIAEDSQNNATSSRSENTEDVLGTFLKTFAELRTPGTSSPSGFTGLARQRMTVEVSTLSVMAE